MGGWVRGRRGAMPGLVAEAALVTRGRGEVGVHRLVGKVEEERLPARGLLADEIQRVIGEFVGDVSALRDAAAQIQLGGIEPQATIERPALGPGIAPAGIVVHGPARAAGEPSTADRVRVHMCWGNYEGPHHHDIPMRDLLPVVLKLKPRALLFEAANPRHAHEWAVFQEIKTPEDKILVPGVITSTTNYVDHPELIAERLVRFAEIVGQERVIAGSDCGFGTFAGFGPVDTDVVWLKLKALAEGAEIATRRLRA